MSEGTLGTTSKSVAALLATIVSVFTVFVTVGRGLVFGSKNNASFYFDLSQDPLGQVSGLFKKLVKQTDKPICISIDDLDRCNADYVVDLLEGIQTAFRANNVAYVVAADREWIRSSFETRYDTFNKTVGDAGQPLGYLFLEKIFQLSTPLPGLSAETRKDFWTEILRKRPADVVAAEDVADEVTKKDDGPEFDRDQLDARISDARAVIVKDNPEGLTYSQAQDYLEKNPSPADRAAVIGVLNESRAAESEAGHALAGFDGLLPDNPRVMKRIINAFAMRQTISLSEGTNVATDVLMRWTIIEQRYPALADILIEQPHLVDEYGPKRPKEKDWPEVLKPFLAIDTIRQIVCLDSEQESKQVLTKDLIEEVTRGQRN